MYSKHWELLHILGGECIKCNNANFYELEVDHINNDGNGERTFYTNLDARYVNNPKRAMQRLQILCKICHNEKHKPIAKIDHKRRNMDLFMLTLKEMEGIHMNPVPEFMLCDNIRSILAFDNNDEARNYIRLMLRQASIYESKPEHYNTV